jgi:hypothetical protein
VEVYLRLIKFHLLFVSDDKFIKFRTRRIGENEAVALDAEHEFWMKIYKKESQGWKKLCETKKKVKLKGKGFKGAVFKKGYLYSPEIMVLDKPIILKLEMGAKNLNKNVKLQTDVYVEIKKVDFLKRINLGCEKTKEYKKYNRCWGWHRTHTYDLGKKLKIVQFIISVKAGPSEMKGYKYKGWEIEVSGDNKTWEKVKDINVVVGKVLSTKGVIEEASSIRYIRINSYGKGYIDWSKISVQYG